MHQYVRSGAIPTYADLRGYILGLGLGEIPYFQKYLKTWREVSTFLPTLFPDTNISHSVLIGVIEMEMEKFDDTVNTLNIDFNDLKI